MAYTGNLNNNSRGAWHTLVISLIIREEHGIQCMPCSSRIISEILPEIQTMIKCVILKPIIHSQIISFSVICPSPYSVCQSVTACTVGVGTFRELSFASGTQSRMH